MLTRHIRNLDPDSRQPEIVQSEIILWNVRVLAIDQAPREKDGQNAVVGKTVTLELKPDQISVLAAARQGGTLSLALRSIADVKAVETVEDDTAKRNVSVNIIRFGVPSSNSALK